MLTSFAPLVLTVLVGTAGTDTTMTVKPGTRLEVDCFAGEIAVRTWPRDAVRVEARHSRRVSVDITRRNGTLSVTGHGRHGIPASIDFRITAPAWMPLELSGVNTEISVEGVKGQVKATSVKGDVVVQGGSEYVAAESVEGDVRVSGARGRVVASAINQDVRVADCVGEILAEAVNGDVVLKDIDSKSVEVSTVNGSLWADGPFKSGGVYTFSTHNGNIVVGLAEHPDAAVSVSTFSGNFSSDFPVRLNETRRGKRFNFILGSGGARLELESFQGSIRLVRGRLVLDRYLKRRRDSEDPDGYEYKYEYKLEHERAKQKPKQKNGAPDPEPDPDPGQDEEGP